MLRDIQRHHTAAGERGETQAWPMVHLVWSCRNRDELQLLDKKLLLDAGYNLGLLAWNKQAPGTHNFVFRLIYGCMNPVRREFTSGLLYTADPARVS
jgi:hypothetical protein